MFSRVIRFAARDRLIGSPRAINKRKKKKKKKCTSMCTYYRSVYVNFFFFFFPTSARQPIYKPFIEFLVSISSDVSGLSVSINDRRPSFFSSRRPPPQLQSSASKALRRGTFKIQIEFNKRTGTAPRGNKLIVLSTAAVVKSYRVKIYIIINIILCWLLLLLSAYVIIFKTQWRRAAFLRASPVEPD